MNNCTERWIKEYKKRGALWLHDNNPVRPHALLTSGKHSGGFFNSGLVLEDPFLLDKACQDLLVLLTGAGCTVYKDVHRVVGPAMGAITLAHSLAYRIAGVTFSSQCFCSYTEKEVLDGENTMVFKRTSVKDGESVLAVEDVLTTGGSVDLTTTAIEKKGGIVLPYVVVLVNRSGLTEINGKKIIALIDRPMPMWAPDDCPLCAAGSEAIRPKGAESWERLNADYLSLQV